MHTTINPNERVDDLHRNGLKLIQNPLLYCFSQDAVLLSAFAKAKRGERVLDLCTGNGVIPILMTAKNKALSYDGLEIQAQSVDLANRSVALNGLSEVIRITHGDVKDASKIYTPQSFDVITANPPYMVDCIQNPSEPLAIARHEVLLKLEDVISAASALLKFGGRFYMIHRPTRLTDIFCLMRQYKIEPKRLQNICPKRGREPSAVLIEGMRGGKSFLRVLPELVIYNSNGSYTKSVIKIYYE